MCDMMFYGVVRRDAAFLGHVSIALTLIPLLLHLGCNLSDYTLPQDLFDEMVPWMRLWVAWVAYGDNMFLTGERFKHVEPALILFTQVIQPLLRETTFEQQRKHKTGKEEVITDGPH